MTDSKKPRGRPRLHPDGLTETLCVPVSKSEYDRLKRLSQERDVPMAKIVRDRLSAEFRMMY